MKPLLSLVFILILLLPGASYALEPLPMADLAAVDDTISRPLRGLLDDYLQLLPVQTSLSFSQEDGSIRSWSEHRDELSRVCRTSPDACAPLLRAQFDALDRDWQQVIGRGTFTLRDGVLISALSDLCDVAGFLEMGDRCHAKYNLAALASMGWLRLTNDHLFLAFQDKDLAERGQMSSWLEHEATITPKEREEGLKRLERDSRAEERDAYALELRNSPSGAYSLWFKLLMQRLAATDEQGALAALVNLSRLAAEMGQEEWAETWWNLGEEFGKPALQASNRGALLGQRFRIDVALARQSHLPVDGVRRLQELIDQKFSFTAQAVEYALLALREGEPDQARDALQRARDACGKTEGCGVTRMEHINNLIALAESDGGGLQRQGEQWQGRLRADMLLGTELQIAWALADRLRESGAVAEAAALYKTLDEQVESWRSQTNYNAADLARFDALKRMRVRVDVDLGIKAPLLGMESLRGQGLLQRLRYQRWFKELGGADDHAARGKLEEQLAGVQRDRQKLGVLAAQASPLECTIYRAALQEFDGITTTLKYDYLNDLAARKNNTNWISRSQALYWYQFTDGFDTFDRAIIALRNDEAYLSWLQVPGGYVATSLAVTPRDLVTDRVYGSSGTLHSLRQRFIPFTALDEAVLQLYRDLLQSGAGASRGRISLAVPEKKGLTLNGQPLWFDANGFFAVGPTAPAGGQQLETFASLRDALYERLLAPLALHYQDARLLIISPDGPLAFLPFETLTRQGVPVLETVDISYVQSLPVYAELKKRITARTGGGEPRLLSVADPLYGPTATGSAGAAASIRGSLKGGGWPPLPGTRAESAAITGLYRNSRKLLGADANKGTLADMQERKLLKRFRILHFATHGYVDDEQSALILSSGSTPESAYLLDSDIAGWDLDSDLVLLSACNTGIGRHQSGEGVVGLPYAFFTAGNLNTLMSLWSVDDAGTAALIPAFMERVRRGVDQVSALNDTKRAFVRGEFGTKLSDPRIWSAFVLYGAPRDQETARDAARRNTGARRP